MMPKEIFLDVTGRCNGRCLICARGASNANIAACNWDISRELWEASKPFVAAADFVDVTGYGEFLLSPIAEEILSFCAENKTPVHMCTNGTLLSGNVQMIKDTIGKFEHIILSIPSHHPELYEIFTGGLAFKKLESGLECISEIAKSVTVSHVIHSQNLSYLPGFIVWYANSIKHENRKLSIRPMIKMRSEHDAIMLDLIPNMADRILDDAAELRLRIGLTAHEIILPHKFRDLNKADRDTVPISTCPHPFRQLFITRHGATKLCCDMPLFEHVNIFDYDNPQMLWSNPAFESLRAELLRGEVPEQCAHCTNMEMTKPDFVSAYCAE